MASGDTSTTDVIERNSISAAGPILHEFEGPCEASPMNPRKSDVHIIQSLAALNLIVSPEVSLAYPKKTPLCAVVTKTALSFIGISSPSFRF
jgi:hypothetical protein